MCLLHIIESAKEIERIQKSCKLDAVRLKRKYEHGAENTLTTRTACLRDLFSPKTPCIEPDNPQKRNVADTLNVLEDIVIQQEERARQQISELENQTRSEKASPKRTSKLSKKEGQRPQWERIAPLKFCEEETPPSYVARLMVEGTIWQPGWYKGEIQDYDEDNNVIHIWYLEDRAVYSFDATR